MKPFSNMTLEEYLNQYKESLPLELVRLIEQRLETHKEVIRELDELSEKLASREKLVG